MTDLIKMYATDPELEKNGVWVDFDSSDAPEGERAQLCILPDEHPDVRAALDRHHRKHERHYRSGKKVPHDVKLEGEIEVATAAVAGWRNVSLGGDGPAAPTYDNRRRLMAEVRFIREQVLLLASRTETFRRELVAEAGKSVSGSSPA